MATSTPSDLGSLRIDRSRKKSRPPSRWSSRWIVSGVLLFLLLGLGRFAYNKLNAAPEVETYRVHAAAAGDTAGAGTVILNATGYIVAAHKIELASKVMGKVEWIGVEKGDRVRQGQILVRLEDVEYKAQVQQARGNVVNLQAQLDQLLHGSRPEEIARATSDVQQSKADLENARVQLERTKKLVQEGVMARQALDDAQARYDGAVAKTNSLQRTFDLAKIGPRQEQIDAMRGMIEQAKGQLAYAQTQLDNTLIRAPVSGTILDRNVEKGEFVTTGFVGDRGAKGYVVTMADLNDLKVELDINQNDFAKLHPRQKGIVTTDAFPDLKYDGIIDEMSPEANRQKATVQVKVKVLNPDDHLRPEMNASVAFVANDEPKNSTAPARPLIVVPASSVKDGAVFVVTNGRIARRAVKTGGVGPDGVRIDGGLSDGEAIVVNPSPDLKDGSKVKVKS